MERNLTYFVADVHLGCDVLDPAGRERRFVDFLNALPENTAELYMLGDIWDFWYEYRDVVPRGSERVLAALIALVDRGVKVWFFKGNHDQWTKSCFESLGIGILEQPCLREINGMVFCLGHGDGLGPVPPGYRILSSVFRSRVLRALFSTLHPWIAFRFGRTWSRHNRLKHRSDYVFKGKDEPLYKFAEAFSGAHKVDCFVFGHFHCDVDMVLDSGARFIILKDWFRSSPYLVFDGVQLSSIPQPKLSSPYICPES